MSPFFLRATRPCLATRLTVYFVVNLLTETIQGDTRLFLLNSKTRWITFCIMGFMLLSGYSTNSHAAENASCKALGPLTFGILPFLSAEQLVERFTPFAEYLHKHIQVPVRIETAPNFLEFARRTRMQQRYDILFTAPHLFPQASQVGYRLIAGVDSPGMHVVVVVPKKSNIFTLADLKGKRLASVQPMSLASLMIKKHLTNHGLKPNVDITLVDTPIHDASLLSSYHGVTDASSLMRPPYEAASKILRNSMRVISETESAPHMPISVSPQMSTECEAEITALLLKMDSHTEGKKVLKHNRFAGFKHADVKDYLRVRDHLLE